ncbi:uncharacterized protein C8Q71DRAFT_360422 [Rhodofomes roseus]|uniref:Uncharacterized protein n=1 Tax=Rhodofomes roseus TaxID=34475 RepID=A0ABQ8K1N8_9APHY|nr:uncharacterized protein C8Q71DRAFT_360422 [Rhodofomes roseus]KAH9830599.1 hypothetical protein C8Q71DRAFT_360422 [Rhodofomes roseus]
MTSRRPRGLPQNCPSDAHRRLPARQAGRPCNKRGKLSVARQYKGARSDSPCRFPGWPSPSPASVPSSEASSSTVPPSEASSSTVSPSESAAIAASISSTVAATEAPSTTVLVPAAASSAVARCRASAAASPSVIASSSIAAPVHLSLRVR